MARLRLISKLLRDTCAQDMIEYALLAGLVAVSAGAVMPAVANSISTMFNLINNTMSSAASNS